MRPFHHKTHYWHLLDDGRVQCDLCPRACKLRSGQKGVCFVRENVDNQVELTSYGRSSGFCIDPVEKKPLNHFLPGSSVLSFGTAGCNLACKFCQNWDISKSREIDKLSSEASPESIVRTASDYGCRSIAFTYNDPVVFHEYAVDVAKACRESNIKTVAVTAGYICEQPRKEFFKFIDAANIDLKAFTESFYYKLTGGHLQAVLDTLLYLKNETSVWFELTTLLIPGKNDSEEEIDAMTRWVVTNLGVDVPMHFTAFHPDWKMMDVPQTSIEILQNARAIAASNGVRHAYTGNVYDESGQTTYCHQCLQPLVVRNWYQIGDWSITADGCCEHCMTPVAGVYESRPGNWGSKRLPVRVNTKVAGIF